MSQKILSANNGFTNVEFTTSNNLNAPLEWTFPNLVENTEDLKEYVQIMLDSEEENGIQIIIWVNKSMGKKEERGKPKTRTHLKLEMELLWNMKTGALQ